MTIRQLDLNPAGWANAVDFYDALLVCVEAPAWHGRNIDALVDSIIIGGINKVEPPFKIIVHGAHDATGEARSAMYEAFGFLAEAGDSFEIEGQRISLTVGSPLGSRTISNSRERLARSGRATFITPPAAPVRTPPGPPP